MKNMKNIKKNIEVKETIRQPEGESNQPSQALRTARLALITGIAILLGLLAGCGSAAEEPAADFEFSIPAYEGEAAVEVNDNKPVFEQDLLNEESFEEYGPLDKHGRCTDALANLSYDTMPAEGEERGNISEIHPTGWKSRQGWERCHLIAWKLSAENDNKRNLVTGTHYMNSTGMAPYEDEVCGYIRRTGNHVLYEAEPVFRGKDMVCAGVRMQAESVEDNGRGVSFHVFCFNVEPGYDIDYKTGSVAKAGQSAGQTAGASQNSYQQAEGSQGSGQSNSASQNSGSGQRVYILNTNTMRFHYPSCASVAEMSGRNREKVKANRQDLIRQGYEPCGECEP